MARRSYRHAQLGTEVQIALSQAADFRRAASAARRRGDTKTAAYYARGARSELALVRTLLAESGMTLPRHFRQTMTLRSR